MRLNPQDFIKLGCGHSDWTLWTISSVKTYCKAFHNTIGQNVSGDLPI